MLEWALIIKWTDMKSQTLDFSLIWKGSWVHIWVSKLAVGPQVVLTPGSIPWQPLQWSQSFPCQPAGVRQLCPVFLWPQSRDSWGFQEWGVSETPGVCLGNSQLPVTSLCLPDSAIAYPATRGQVRGAAVGGGAYLVETFVPFASPPLLLWEMKQA